MSERYEIKGRLGRGGIGAVYEGFDTQLDRAVAIKRLLPIEETHLNEADTGSLSREAAALAKFQHPNVVTIFGFEEDEDGPFVVTELINGENLKVIVEKGALSVADFQEFVSQSLDAMIAAEQMNLLHRDIKPANLMLLFLPSGKFQVKILDFGLAKFSQTPSQQTLDHKGSFLGSIDYIAPEQIERKPLDQRTDLYSFGCVCYFALTQKPPFEGSNLADTMKNHLNHKVTPIAEIRPDLPPAIGDWVMKMIALKSSDRPLNASTAVQEFEQAKLGVSPDMADGVSGSVEEEIEVTPAPGTAPQKPAPQTGTQPTTASGKILLTGPVAAPPRNTSSIPLKNTGPRRTAAPKKTGQGNVKKSQEKSKTPLIIGLVVAVILFSAVMYNIFTGGGSGENDNGKVSSNNQPKSEGITPNKGPSKGNKGKSKNAGKDPKLPSPSSVVTPVPDAATLAKYKLPVEEGLVGHYVASALTFKLDQKTVAKAGDQIGSWGNLNRADKDQDARYLARLFPDSNADWCPRLAYLGPSNLSALNGPHSFLQFEKGDSLGVPSARPTSANLTGRNISVTIVYSLTGAGGPIFSLKTASKDDERMLIVPKNERIDALIRAAAEKSLPATVKYNGEKELVIATHILDGGSHSLHVMNSKGKRLTSGPRKAIERALSFSGYFVGNRTQNAEYQMSALVAELSIFNRSLSDDERVELEDHLYAKYFRKPGGAAPANSKGKGKSKGKSSPPVINDAANSGDNSVPGSPPVKENLVAWYSAQSDVLSDKGEPAQIGSEVKTWVNLADEAGQSHQPRHSEKKIRGAFPSPPTYSKLDPDQYPELKAPIHVVSVRTGQNLVADSPQFPMTEMSGQPISVVTLVRSDPDAARDSRARLMIMSGKPAGSGPDVDPDFFFNLSYSSDNFGFTMKTETPDGPIWASTGAKRENPGFNIVFAQWDPENARHEVYTQAPAGKVFQSKSEKEAAKGPYNIQRYVLGGANELPCNSDYAEFLIYTRFLTTDDRKKISSWLADRYFAN